MLTCKFVAVGSYCLRTPWDQKRLCSYIMNASKRMLTQQNRPGLYITHKTQQTVCLCKQVTLRKRHKRGWVSHMGKTVISKRNTLTFIVKISLSCFCRVWTRNAGNLNAFGNLHCLRYSSKLWFTPNWLAASGVFYLHELDRKTIQAILKISGRVKGMIYVFWQSQREILKKTIQNDLLL